MAFFCSLWNATVVDLENVISVQLSVQQANLTGIFNETVTSASLYFDVELWACYKVFQIIDLQFDTNKSQIDNPQRV